MEVLKRLKSDMRSQAIPVIILSASTNRADAEECAAYGASGYLTKPIDMKSFQDLIATINLTWASDTPSS